MGQKIFLLLGMTLLVLLMRGGDVALAAEKAPAKKAVAAKTEKGTQAGSVEPSWKELFPTVKLLPASEQETAGLREAAAFYGMKDYVKAMAILTPLAEAGSARAAFSLGLMAMRGHGVPMSTEVAERWWIKSSKGGFPDAQYHLGFMHHQSLRGGRNPKLIAHLWSLAAAQGQGDAMYGLGFMYAAGDGVTKDLKKSLKMFTDAADLGHPDAASKVGVAYKYGRDGATKNAAKAKIYLEKAADAGMPQARQELDGMK